MVTLTIGYVSGIIAAIIFVLQFVVPNAVIVVLVGLLKNNHSAVTWSVVERNLLSSHWPVFLRSDSAATKGVDRSIRLVTWLRPLGLLLITVAAVVTPLGLYDEINPEADPVPAPMIYVADNGPFGYGTPSREQVYFTRKCGGSLPVQCPGTAEAIEYGFVEEDGEMVVQNATWDDIDLRIPKVLAELYQSGLHQHPGSMSSFFDIQSRQWGWSDEEGVMQNKSYVADSFRYLSTVVLDDAYKVIEGLVVDTKNGAVGFRNHTVPDAAGLGAEWSEELLFIEPVTECVPMNVSLEFRVPFSSDLQEAINITLVDNGGMTDFEQKYPLLDLDGAQIDPQLRNRAYKAGWMTNVYNMLTMNLTRPSPDAFGYMNSHVGARYPLESTQTSANLAQLSISTYFDAILRPPSEDVFSSNISVADDSVPNYSNPFGMSSSNFSDISLICSGAGDLDLANISKIHVECGLIFGAARRRDGSQTLVFEPGTWYVQDIFSCASTSRASIKSVDFRYNATRESGHTLEALTVVDIQPKNYSSKDEMPLWGVEDTDYYISDLSQLWGFIDPQLEKSVNLSTIRREHLYLPGYGGTLYSTNFAGIQNVPGNTGPTDLLYGLYSSTEGGYGMQDFSGAYNYAMLTRWRELSKTAKTVPKILNLIWADLAANMFVGTRSWNTKSQLPPNTQDPKFKKRQSSSAESSDDETTLVPVKLYRRQIRYRWRFAIPAVLSLLLIALILAMAFLLFVLRRATPARIDHYLTHLSSGRLLGAMQYPSEDKVAPTSEWIKRVGRRKSDLDKMFPTYRGGMPTSGGLSPFFAQHTGYWDRHSPASSDYDMTRGLVSSGGKGYIQLTTRERPGS